MEDIHSLRDSWTVFLGQFEPFDWYLTQTFREESHPEQADKRFRRFVRVINEKLFGPYYRKKGLGITWVRALEYQKRGVLHFHALIGGGLNNLEKQYFKDLWNRENGFAKIETYDPERGARGYLSKYVMKGGQIDIFCSPTKQS